LGSGTKKKTKNSVKNTINTMKTVSNTTSPLSASGTLSFDFSYRNWLKGLNGSGFNNMLKNESQFATFIFEIMNIIIPTVHDNWNVIKNNDKKQFPHCHSVAKDKIAEIEKIIIDIYGKQLLDLDGEDSFNYWQLGIKQSVRLIAIYNHNKNTMYPVFVDYHHQIHESVKHNQKDLKQYGFCPIEHYV
jgi:hypothetical protein